MSYHHNWLIVWICCFSTPYLICISEKKISTQMSPCRLMLALKLLLGVMQVHNKVHRKSLSNISAAVFSHRMLIFIFHSFYLCFNVLELYSSVIYQCCTVSYSAQFNPYIFTFLILKRLSSDE